MVNYPVVKLVGVVALKLRKRIGKFAVVLSRSQQNPGQGKVTKFKTRVQKLLFLFIKPLFRGVFTAVVAQLPN